MKKLLVLLALVCITGCAPVGHITGNVDPLNPGDATIGFDVEIKKLNRNLEELNQKLVAPKALEPK